MKKLTICKKVGIVGSLASIIGLIIAMWPVNNNNDSGQVDIVYGNGNINADRDVIINTKTEPQNIIVEYLPISELSHRLNNVNLPSGYPTTSIRLISENWGIDYNFVVSSAFPIGKISTSLMSQLALREHALINTQQLGRGCFYDIDWFLTINGKEHGYNETLESIGAKNGAIAQFKFKTSVSCTTSG